MVKARIKLNVQGVVRYVESLKDFFDRTREETLSFAEDKGVKIMQEEVPKGKTKRLFSSCRSERQGNTVRIVNDAPHASIIDGEGRTTSSPGRYVPAINRRLVAPSKHNPNIGTHPGARKTPFSKRTAERLAMDLEEFIRQKVRESP